MNEKYLVTLELRYTDFIISEDETRYVSKISTIGVFDSFDESCIHGNNILTMMEAKFELHKFPNGSRASKDKNRLNSKNNLVTDLAYLKTPFNFFLKRTILKYDDVNVYIDEALKAEKRYESYIKNVD